MNENFVKKSAKSQIPSNFSSPIHIQIRYSFNLFRIILLISLLLESMFEKE